MKILSAQQIRQADAYTIEHEPVSSLELMERAATAACHALLRFLEKRQLKPKRFQFFCGRGNNGGDGLVMARLLSHTHSVAVWICPVPEKPSPDFAVNLKRLQLCNNVAVQTLSPDKPLPELHAADVCIDCIFGSGLNRPPSGFAASVIAHMNRSDAFKVAIDIPSGMFADSPVIYPETVFHANYTVTFELPKLSFLYDAYYRFTGEWEVVPIGLHPEYLRAATTNNFRIDIEQVRQYYKRRSKIAHKGDFGHGLLIAGSLGKMGAAVLAARAAMRAGIGLLSTAVPAVGIPVMQTAVPEAMCLPDTGNTVINLMPDNISLYDSIGIGPGLGQDKLTAAAIDECLRKPIHCPMVWDADALNLLAKHPHWWERIPAGSILTPHPKEFERLAGVALSDFKRHKLQMALSSKHRCVILLKGANTCITTPEGQTFFNSSGNPGMATGGSGDVLTGILMALLAQQYSAEQAAVIGAYLHGLAGDMAAEQLSQEALKAGDLIDFLPAAWKKIIT